MKKFISIFAILTIIPTLSWGVTVKKSAAVATKKADKMASATSLLPGVIGMISNVQALRAQQQQMAAECAPTSTELETVNSLVKEWAKTGEVDWQSAVSGLGEPCLFVAGDDFEKNKDSSAYGYYVELNPDDVCYVQFGEPKVDKGMVWNGFPKATSAKVCLDGNNKNCKYVSNIYDIFSRIPFTEADYTKSELSKVAKLIEKSEKCAPEKLKAAKRELYGGFLTQTLGSIGQTSGAAGTPDIINAVSAMGGSGNIQSMLPSLSQMALQSLDK